MNMSCYVFKSCIHRHEKKKNHYKLSELESQSQRARELELECQRARAREIELESQRARARELESQSQRARNSELELESQKQRARARELELGSKRARQMRKGRIKYALGKNIRRLVDKQDDVHDQVCARGGIYKGRLVSRKVRRLT